MRNFFTILFTLTVTFSFCQTAPFSGIIYYKYQYFDSLNNDISQSQKGKKDLESHYYINNIGYKSINEDGKLTQVYSTKNNLYHFQHENKWMQIAASMKFPELIKIEQIPGEEAILGNKCKKVKIVSSMGETIYWYSLDLKVNGENYSSHLFGNWYDYLTATDGGITLKYEMKMKGSYVICTAYGIEKVELKEEEFVLKN